MRFTERGFSRPSLFRSCGHVKKQDFDLMALCMVGGLTPREAGVNHLLGVDAISQALVTGYFIGIGPGSTPMEVQKRLGAAARQLHGSKPHRLLRLDFGLVEATFAGEPDWLCQWVSVHTHRLAEMPSLAGECAERFGLEFSETVAWGQLSPEVRDIADLVDMSPYSVRYRFPAVTATVHLSESSEGDELGRVIEKISIGV